MSGGPTSVHVLLLAVQVKDEGTETEGAVTTDEDQDKKVNITIHYFLIKKMVEL